MKKWIPIIILLLAVLVSCKENTPDVTPDKTELEKEHPTKAFLKDLRSDSSAEYYISGEFDGYRIYMASTFSNYFPYHDTTMNALYYNETIGLDNMHLLRQNEDRTARIAIYFDKAKFSTRAIPYILPHANLEVCEAAQMEFINMKKLGTTSQGAANDDF